MSKQEEIKQALAAASTEREWDTDGTFIEWRDGCPLNGTYRKIAITQAPTPEVFNNPNHKNDANLIAKAPEYIAYLLETLEEVLLDRDIAKQNRKQWEKCYDAAEEKSDRLRKELEEKEIILTGRQYTINRLKEQNEEIATMGIRQGEQIYRLLQSEKKQYKELERLRSALETTLFHLKKEYYMSAEDSIEEALAVGQEGEGNQ
ncbi:hypothetical protein [Paenibacillus sp. LK1]|uniref:hypothetical protein n=1 Tax=Paenibacillus sp. LK1 TaxID=2053014 RepID=UPI000C198CE2|nr:hypothetical protein [Paenibacillus sp. LK1]PIH58256.1 hypothetical protein CS562_17450 [Paenibacillus sp. LK1]